MHAIILGRTAITFDIGILHNPGCWYKLLVKYVIFYWEE